RLRTALSPEVSELVLRGDVALGLRYGHDPSPHLEAKKVHDEPMVAVCSPQHRLVKAASSGRLRSLEGAARGRSATGKQAAAGATRKRSAAGPTRAREIEPQALQGERWITFPPRPGTPREPYLTTLEQKLAAC